MRSPLLQLVLVLFLITSCGGGSGSGSQPSQVQTPAQASPNTSGSTSTTTDRADNTTPNCSEYQSETASSETQTETPVNVQRCALRHGGLDRVFYMYIPASYTSSSDNQPLLFSLHGYTSSALTNLSYTGFESPANANGFIVIYPQGSILQSTGATHWNVGGWTTSSTTDDVNYIETIIDYMLTEYRIDPDRIYSTGMSNGGFMSYRLACELGTKIAAIASVTGSMTPETLEACNPAHPTSVLQIHGVLDNTVPRSGNDGMKPIDEVMTFWQINNRCNETPETKVISDLTLDGFGGTQTNYPDCQNGVEVTLFLLDKMGHEWPLSGAHDVNAPTAIWNFLSRFNRYGLIQ